MSDQRALGDADTLGGLLERRVTNDEEEETATEGTDALRAPGEPERRYDASRLLTDARKTGNFLRQLGVGPGRAVVIADVPVPESALTLFGATLLGAPVRFVALDALTTGALDADARVLVGPGDAIDAIPVNVAKRVAYGDAPADPEVAYFERDVWSENPTFPPGGPDAGEVAIEARGRAYTHRELLDATERVVDEQGFETGIEVAVRAPLTDPRTVVAGVLAPLASGGTILFPDEGTHGDRAIVPLDVGWGTPEPANVDLAVVPLDGR